MLLFEVAFGLLLDMPFNPYIIPPCSCNIINPITLSFLLLCVARKSLNFTLSLQSKMGKLNIQDINDGANFSCNLNPLTDPEEFKRQGKMIIDFLADYYQNVEKYPVRSQVEPGYLRKLLPDSAPHNAEPIETILADVQNHIVPGLTHWQSPNFFAYFPCTGSIAGFLGEMLMTGFNVNPFSWMTSPAATELEGIVMDWVGKVLNLPQAFLFSGGGGGVIQATTCEAMLSTLCGARDKKLREIGRNKLDKLVVYASDQTHCSFQKAAHIAGIHPDNFRAIKTKRSEAFSLSPDSLRFVILLDVEAGLTPLYLCATIGTTSTTTVDPLKPLCDVAKDYEIWVHVDAAYAGSACICPEFQHFLYGVEGASSFSFNAHKWFFANLDCCCLWVKEPKALVQALSTSAEILRNKATDSMEVVDYKDWQIPLSRRFRALKLWIVLRCYGVENLQNVLRSHVDMAKHFEGLVGMDKRFEAVVPRNFSLVCFRISPLAAIHRKVEGVECANDLTRKLLDSINESGCIFVTHAVVGGIYVIRFAIGAPLTDYRHVEMAWKVVQQHATSILSTS